MSIEIRAFEGSAHELAAFTNRVWATTYRGQMLTPIWSPEHFERDLLSGTGDRDLLIAAYDGTRIVGSHPAKPLAVRMHDKSMVATWASFLSVDPEYRHEGVALKLQSEYVRRHRDREIPINFGFNYIRSTNSLGPEYWRRQGVHTVAKLGVWSRALDHTAVSRFEPHRLEGWGARATGIMQRPPQQPNDMSGLRLFQQSDVTEGVQLLNQAGDRADLAYLWDEATAVRQLSFPNLSRTVVLEREGHLRGLVNYTLLEVMGRCQMCVARLDVATFGTLRRKDRRRLLRAAIWQMYQDGAKGVVMLRGSWQPWRDMLATGFLPLPAEFKYVGLLTRGPMPLRKVRRLHVLWR